MHGSEPEGFAWGFHTSTWICKFSWYSTLTLTCNMSHWIWYQFRASNILGASWPKPSPEAHRSSRFGICWPHERSAVIVLTCGSGWSSIPTLPSWRNIWENSMDESKTSPALCNGKRICLAEESQTILKGMMLHAVLLHRPVWTSLSCTVTPCYTRISALRSLENKMVDCP